MDAVNPQYYSTPAFGKIARRLLHTHNLPVVSRWRSLRKDVHSTEEKGGKVYPPQILDMAYEEYLKGMRD